MARYEITAPDGNRYEITAPDDATESQVMAYAQHNYKPKEEVQTGNDLGPARGTSVQPDVPKWGMENPNLFGAYGAAREVAKTGIEAAGQAIGAAGGALVPVPGATLAGSGVGYATAKRGAGKLVSAADKALGLPEENQDDSSFGMDVAKGAAFQGVGNLISKGVARLVPQSMIDKMYASAMKLPISGKPGALVQRAKDIKTGLDEGAIPKLNVGTVDRWLKFKGHQEVADKIYMLDDMVSDAIESGAKSGDMVSSKAVASYLDDLLDKGVRVKKADPNFLNSIKKVKKEFLKGKDDISVKDAQEIKKHIYKTYQDFYGAPDDVVAYVQGKKQIARGLKEELERRYPQIKELNMKEGELLNFLGPLGRAAGRVQNRDIVGLGMQTIPMAGQALGGTPTARALTAAKILDTPSIKARVSVLLHRVKKSKISGIRQVVGKITPTALIATDNQE